MRRPPAISNAWRCNAAGTQRPRPRIAGRLQLSARMHLQVEKRKADSEVQRLEPDLDTGRRGRNHPSFERVK